MNEKFSLQNLVDSLSQHTGVSKKIADSFAKSFFDTIVEALYMGEDVIKVKGLGTFKLVDVESRESVNVSNGERIIIPGYKKVSFVPDDSVVETLNASIMDTEELNTIERKKDNEELNNQEEQEGISDESAVKVETHDVQEKEEVVVVDETEHNDEDNAIETETTEAFVESPKQTVTESVDHTIDELIQVPVPEKVELPLDELSGIDMLICTPESIDEIRSQYEEAKTKAERAIDEARKANTEMLRLELLLQRLENNVAPESENYDEVELANKEATEAVDFVNNDSNDSINNDSEQESTNHLVIEQISEETEQLSDEDTTKESEGAEDAAQNKDEALNRYLQSEVLMKQEEKKSKKTSRLWWTVTPIIIILIAFIVFFMYKTSVSIEQVEKVPDITNTNRAKETENTKASSTKSGNADKENKNKGGTNEGNNISTSVSSATNTDSLSSKQIDNQSTSPNKAEDNKKENENKVPQTYTIKPGESLTRISQRFYGTKDSVNAIIRINTFKDPNNVPIGATIKLP